MRTLKVGDHVRYRRNLTMEELRNFGPVGLQFWKDSTPGQITKITSADTCNVNFPGRPPYVATFSYLELARKVIIVVK